MIGLGFIGYRKRLSSSRPSIMSESGLFSNGTIRRSNGTQARRTFLQIVSSAGRLQALFADWTYRYLAPAPSLKKDAFKSGSLSAALPQRQSANVVSNSPTRVRLSTPSVSETLAKILAQSVDNTELTIRRKALPCSPARSNYKLPLPRDGNTISPSAHKQPKRREPTHLERRPLVKHHVDPNSGGAKPTLAGSNHYHFAPLPTLAPEASCKRPSQRNFSGPNIIHPLGLRHAGMALVHQYPVPDQPKADSSSNHLLYPSIQGKDVSTERKIPLSGKIIIDGSTLGQWVVAHLEQELCRPQAGITGVDPRSAHPRSRLSPF